MQKPKLLILVITLIALIVLSLFQKTEASVSVELILGLSDSMDKMIGDKSNIDSAREIIMGILNKTHQPLNSLILYGHRDKDKCNDVEKISLKGMDSEAINKMLGGYSPKGKAPIAAALRIAAEGINDGDYKNIILITDGETTCEEDLLKTAREIKERHDYRITIHVIGLAPSNVAQLISVANAGYGTFYRVKNKSESEEAVEGITGKINNPFIHQPKVINLDDMVLIPAGEFLMGSANPYDDPNEHPQHVVWLDAFYIDRYEVTQQQFKSVMGYNPSMWIGSDLPVERVSWFEAKEFCEKVGKRLPTEAEWEKAAKGGRDDRWPGTNEPAAVVEYGWFSVDTGDAANYADGKTHPVGQRMPNGYGIYDMAGNASEWVNDWMDIDYYKKSPRSNPPGPDKGVIRALRGGNWDNHLYEVRTTNRFGQLPEVKYANNGFRCVRSAE